MSPARRGAPVSFGAVLGSLLGIGLLLRIGYVLTQPGNDPWFARPGFDGAFYLDWARTILEGGGVDGAFYLAPLYPNLLALFVGIAGESFGALYLLQHSLALGTATTIALAGRRRLGDGAALAAAGLFLFYSPLIFFASRPLGETLAIFLLFCALAAATRQADRGALGAGLLGGLAALARPNLLLVPALWTVGELARGRFRRAALLGLGTGLVLSPVLVRNLVVSGHPVLVSSNGGLTSYHGNHPKAQGVYIPGEGLSGDPALQRREATDLARQRSGRELDPVEADRWWGREALRARAGDPLGSVVLVTRRAAMMLDSHEFGLDYAPSLDSNRWGLNLRPWVGVPLPLLPLGALLGLAVGGVILRGFRGTGGFEYWAALLACAAAPLLFYVSSRYRLPFAAMLVVPAGCGLAALFEGGAGGRRRTVAVTAGILVCLLSLRVPFHGIKTLMAADHLAMRANQYRKIGDLGAAQREMSAALALPVRSAPVLFNAGVLAEAQGDLRGAESAFREALEIDRDRVEAAGNLSAILIRRGEAAEAIPLLLHAVQVRPSHDVCWNNLVVAYLEVGDERAAGRTAADAQRRGAKIDPGLLEELHRRTEP